MDRALSRCGGATDARVDIAVTVHRGDGHPRESGAVARHCDGEGIGRDEYQRQSGCSRTDRDTRRCVSISGGRRCDPYERPDCHAGYLALSGLCPGGRCAGECRVVNRHGGVVDGAIQNSQVSNFNPNAQVMPAQSQAAAMARLQFKKPAKSSSIDSDNETQDSSELEIEVATIGLIKIDQEQLERFKERVEKGLKRQEEQIMDAVNTFGANEKDLRHAIGSIMLF